MTFSIFINFSTISIFFLFEKKLFIESICILPIPSRSIRLSKILSLFLSKNNSLNLCIETKKPARIFAFSWPICLIPVEKINLSILLSDLVIAF